MENSISQPQKNFLKNKSVKTINNYEYIIPIATIDSNDDILSRELMNTKDICILLDRSDEVALKISKETKK